MSSAPSNDDAVQNVEFILCMVEVHWRICMACEKVKQWVDGKNAKHKQRRNFIGKVCCPVFIIWGFFQDYLTV